jgi:hypothetical protein
VPALGLALLGLPPDGHTQNAACSPMALSTATEVENSLMLILPICVPA